MISLDICRGNLPEKFMKRESFARLVSEVVTSDRAKEVSAQWLEDELYVIGRGETEGSFDLPRDGSYSNPQNSAVAWVIGITDQRPETNAELFFDRGRSDAADIDMDFMDKRRDEVKDYMRRKFKNVAAIATYTMFKDKNVIKDAAKVLGVPLDVVNRATKDVNAPPDHDFFDFFIKSPQGKEFSQAHPDVMKLAGALRGRIRNTGIHAAGIVVSKNPLNEVASIQTATNPADRQGPRVPLLGVDMDEAADIGLIKFDFLGLKTLSVIADAISLIKENRNIVVDLNRIGREDPDVYKMLSEGHTLCVFQCEAAPSTKLLMRMGIDSFNDLVVSNALVRPGAMNVFGNSFIKRRQGKERPDKIHPDVDKYMEDTFGLPIYQEQSMRLVSDLAGLGMSTANKVRKITAKKQDPKLLAEYREMFIQGASPKVGREKAEFLWGSIEETASYSFNLSHAVAYSTISYWTAWLKYYYPQEFMVAVLNNETDKDSITDYMIESRRLGMKILLPHVNRSKPQFSIEGSDIRMGMANIKNLSEVSAAKFAAAAPFDTYADLVDFVEAKGTGVNKRQLAALNAIGAAVMDGNELRGDERSNFYEYLGIPEFNVNGVPPSIRAQLTSIKGSEDEDGNITGGVSDTGVYLIRGVARDILQRETWARVDILDSSGSVGIFADPDIEIQTGKLYVFLIANNRIVNFALDSDVKETSEDPFVKFLWALDFPEIPDGMALVVSFAGRKTKAGKDMAYMLLADNQKNLTPVLVFDRIFKKAQIKCQEWSVVDPKLERMKDGTIFLDNVL